MQLQATPKPPAEGIAASSGYPLKALRLLWRYGTETIVALLMAVMVGAVLLQVYCRFVLGNPLSWWDPLESTCRHASLSIL